MIIRSIHHFEDEPELVRWLPGTLLNLYWRRHPSWVVEEGRLEEKSDRLTTFELQVGSIQWVIVYRLYQSVNEFSEGFQTEAKPGDVALIDLMDASQQLPVGIHVFERAVTTLGNSAVYFLTAFPHLVNQHLSVPSSQILAKPIDVNELTGILFEKLEVR